MYPPLPPPYPLQAQRRIDAAGGGSLFTGIERYGSDLLRASAADLSRGWGGGGGGAETVSVEVDPQAHARQAHAVRQKHSKIWGNAVGLQRAYAP